MILSDRVDAGLSLSGKSALVYVAANLRVVALTRQADVLVVPSSSNTVTLVELTVYWWKGSSKLRWCGTTCERANAGQCM